MKFIQNICAKTSLRALIGVTVLAFLFLVGCKGLYGPSKKQQAATEEPIQLKEVTVSAKEKEPPIAPAKGPYHPSKTLKSDLLHTKLEVRFDWTKKQVLGLATLQFKPWFYPQNQVEIDAVGFEIHSVRQIKAKNKSISAQYLYDGKVLKVSLDSLYTKDKIFILEIDYTAKPDDNEVGGSAAITSDKGLYFINADGKDPNKPKQIWTQGETQANSKWFPTIDSPNEKMTQEISITVDTGMATLSNGKLLYSTVNKDGTRTDVWEQKLPHAPYLTMLAIGKYAIVKDKWRNIPVEYYVEPEFKKDARAIFGNTPEMLEFFSQKFGFAYPWAKYSQVIVKDFVSGAMENTSATVLMDAVQVEKRSLVDNHWDGIIAHELAHHWFGDLVTCESWSNLPLNESFANYSEYLWSEYKFGKDQADYENDQEAGNYLRESFTKQEPLIRYHYLNKEDMFDSHSYAKGGRILHMLRKVIGDDAFFASLKLYLNTHAFKPVEVHHLRQAFEEVTGQDLNWFFNQWFMKPGHPTIELKWTFNDGVLTLVTNQVQDTTYTPIYKIPTFIDIVEGGEENLGTQKTKLAGLSGLTVTGKANVIRLPITLTSKSDTFRFPLRNQPQVAIFDPEQVLLSVEDYDYSTQESIAEYYNGKSVVTRRRALWEVSRTEKLPEVIQLYRDALSDPFWAIRELAIARLASYDSAAFAESKTQIRQMALTDPKSAVRAEALEALSKKDPLDLEVFKKCLKDTSYKASGIALKNYLNGDAADKLLVLKEFQKNENPYYLPYLAEYYEQNNPEGTNEWFVKSITKPIGENVMSLLISYGKYLKKHGSTENQKAGILVLKEIGISSSSLYQRFGAYSALKRMSGIEGVNDALREIKEKEKNPELKQAYEGGF